jgi:hypothetical protein
MDFVLSTALALLYSSNGHSEDHTPKALSLAVYKYVMGDTRYLGLLQIIDGATKCRITHSNQI